MTNTINKILQIGLWLVLGVSVVLFILFYVNGEEMTDTVLSWGQILLAVTVALLIIFPIVHFIKNPKSALKFLLVIVVFGVLFLVSYMFAQGNIDAKIYEVEHVTSNLSRLIGSGLILVYILAGLALVSIVISAIVNAFK
ncbi:MAG: hypothetical protein K9G58_16065 [Bacteroidales bacterium]|nr:hypothetical protein [Bacteroidales bacterium]MCF8388266.1 hypothetical protein [Bacteroidales bacterium]MCF8399684.1 hypothetical protein [Bacteroidales bacterium]